MFILAKSPTCLIPPTKFPQNREIEKEKNKAVKQKKKQPQIEIAFCGAYETRTRDLLRDRQAF